MKNLSTMAEMSAVQSYVDDGRVLEVEQALIRIPSSTFKEHQIADYLAERMRGIGLEVSMMDVVHPSDPRSFSRQPVGILRGTGGGPSLMLNGHMDPGVEMSGWTVDPYGAKFEDGWVWGMGAHDDKGGIAAAFCGLEAVIQSGKRLRGDVLLCPVIAHKLGGAGTRALLRGGVSADYCINMEHSNNTIANVCVGVVMVGIRVQAPELFFRYSPEAKAQYWNPIEQICEIIRRIGPSLDPIPEGSWMTFEPHPELPGFPTHTFDTVHKEHYYHRNHTGMSSREAELQLQFRTVPGQSLQSLEVDLTRLLEGIRRDHPAFNYQLTLPAAGTAQGWCQDPMECPTDHPLVQALACGQRFASHAEPVVGGWGRLGNVGDGNIIAAAGIPSVQYGPGDIRIYREWPTADERVLLSDLVIAAKAIAAAIVGVCA
ncbi:MAG: Acetylornithine deacetylase/Succinyl-diaminopimelate desuccinylase [Herbaspirillum sp.]|nr:Acetylornithine deacetylase/Succinyl-diaminopimelate desuccinylase [Herbaspirillum sp.]